MNTALVVISLTAVSSLAASARAQPADDPLLSESRVIVDEFARTLQAALQQALSEGGPAAAIDVCKREAIEIASELSRRHGARVGRTSLRTRNAMNLPEPWQTEVLTSFAIEAERGNTPAPPSEYFSRETDDTARYMRAIPTGGLCLVCHGTAIPTDVAERLDREYPFDVARGYEAGDIRGAFSIVWPAMPANAALRESDGAGAAAR